MDKKVKMKLDENLQKEINLIGSYYEYQPCNRRNCWKVKTASGIETKYWYNIGTNKIFTL